VRPDLQFGSNINFSVAYWIRLSAGYGAVAPMGGDLPYFSTAVNSLGGAGIDLADAYGYGTADPVPATAPDPLTPGAWGASLYNGGGAGTGYEVYGHNSDTINDGNYHSLIQVVNRTNGTFTTYVDGLVAGFTKEGGTSVFDIGDIDSGEPASIGQDPTGEYGETGDADIYDFGVWRTALTPLQVASIYIAGASNKLSYAYVPITFYKTNVTSTTMTLVWSFGTLLSATNVAGPYTAVAGAVSPYTVSTTTGRLFYRTSY